MMIRHAQDIELDFDDNPETLKLPKTSIFTSAQRVHLVDSLISRVSFFKKKQQNFHFFSFFKIEIDEKMKNVLTKFLPPKSAKTILIGLPLLSFLEKEEILSALTPIHGEKTQMDKKIGFSVVRILNFCVFLFVFK